MPVTGFAIGNARQRSVWAGLVVNMTRLTHINASTLLAHVCKRSTWIEAAMVTVRIAVGVAFSLLLKPGSICQRRGTGWASCRHHGRRHSDAPVWWPQTGQIRLAEIDAPESRQPFGTRARQELSDLVFGKDVGMTVQDIDRYGRTVGRVYAGSVDVKRRDGPPMAPPGFTVNTATARRCSATSRKPEMHGAGSGLCRR